MSDFVDPFATKRRHDGLVDGSVGGQDFKMVLRYADLKNVCKDWSTYSSDAPFRVPIPSEEDVRSVRQLPIETNPPDHTEYRSLVRGPFSRDTSMAIESEVANIVGDLLDSAIVDGKLEVVRGFALPIQSRSLAFMLGRPQSEADHWISWGTHVFRDLEASSTGSAQSLDAYLEEAIDAAIADPGSDFFGLLVRSEFKGRQLTRDEILGFANLAFAGGRDTVIHLIANSIHYLATNQSAFDELRGDPSLIKSATEEFLRFFSPITPIGRVVAKEAELLGRQVHVDETVSICFASANRDEFVFDRPDQVILDRRPNRHVAFGHGPHTCLGAPHTRMILSTVLERLVGRVSRLVVLEATQKVEDLGELDRVVSFDPLWVELL